MKRDMELVRKIIFHFEKAAGPVQDTETISDALGVPREVVGYHLMLLLDGGLICLIGAGAGYRGAPNLHYGIAAQAQFLTWQGHEFLDSIRDDTVWAEVRSKGTDLSFQLVLQLAIAFGMRKLGLS